ncbi:MAG: SpaA isopeptide-forming pilin-related protein, partial [Sporolactobacillus sp.]
ASGKPAVVSAGELKNYQGSVQMTKTDASGNGLAGAIFKITDLHGTMVQQNLKSTDGGMVSATGLAPGSYYFVETTAPNGYIQNLEQLEFTIDAEANGLPSIVIIPNKFLNYQGSATLTKEKADGSPLAGATFKVVDKNGNTVESNLISDPQGLVTAPNLAPGDYSFMETSAAPGYVLNTEAMPFTIGASASGKPAVVSAGELKNYQGSATLTKEKADGSPLAGATFKVVDKSGNTVETNLTSDSQGIVTATGLAPGDYSFVETSAAPGYVLNTEAMPFTIGASASGEPAVVSAGELKNYQGSVQMTKTDSSGKGLAGAIFTITDLHGTMIQENLKSIDGGLISATGLAPGSYYFVETIAPNGYLVDATPVPFTIAATANGQPAEQTVSKQDQQNSVTLTKVDKNDNNIHLQGAVFELQDSNGNAVTTGAAGNQLPATWTTDANGQFTVTGLAPGSYQFVETKAPANYDLDATPIPFTITNKDTSSQELTATDKLTAGAVQLTKVDKNDTNIHLQGATFKLEDSKGNAVTTDSDGKALPSTWTTDSNGLFTVGNLAPGDYQFIETKAPYGYDLDATPIPFTIAKSQQKAVEITATDSLTPGDVRLTKVDANDKNAVLKGAVFKLEDSKGNTLKTGLTTDSNGQFIVKGLAPGNYYFVETTAPTGYQLDDTPIPFTIEKAQAHAVEITATDKSKPIVLKGQSGVTYNIVDNDGHIIRRGVMADEQGNVIVEGLKPGSYHLVRAVEAYASSPVSKNLPTTGDTNDIIGVGAGVAMLLVGGLLAFLARRRND